MLYTSYYIEENGDKFIVKSLVVKNGREYRNFVAESESREGAENIIKKLEML